MSKKFELAGQLDLFNESVCEGKRSDPSWAFAPLQPGAYGAIAADPPWSFATWSKAGQGKSASLAAPDCVLLLWATLQLHQAFSVMQCWGFDFKSSGAWAKQSSTGARWAFGTGFLLRSAAEFWLIGTRGRPKPESRSERYLIVAPVREHSRKPDQAYEMLERMFPSQRRCELFARFSRPGWDQWGLEIEKFRSAA